MTPLKKPRYIENILAIIFIGIGILFLIFSGLAVMGIVKPTAHSKVQDPIMIGAVYFAVGGMLCGLSFVLRIISQKKDVLNRELLMNGVHLIGKVEKIYLQHGVKLNRQSPYRICYIYSYQGVCYHHKSCLLWEKPYFSPGDAIDVYANEFGKSTLKV